MENVNKTKIADLEANKNIKGLEEAMTEAEGSYDMETAELVKQALDRVNGVSEKIDTAEEIPEATEKRVEDLGGSKEIVEEKLGENTSKMEELKEGIQEEVKQVENPETVVNLEIKKENLLKQWEQHYESSKRTDEKLQKREKFLNEIRESGIEVESQSPDKLSSKFGISRDELFKAMPELYKDASEKDLSKYAYLITKESVDSKSAKEKYETLDKVMQNTPADVLKKMMQQDGFLAQQINEMQGVYGQEIGSLLKKTEDQYYSPQDVIAALNYMGSAGKLLNKEKIAQPISTMVEKLLQKSEGDYSKINYENLCQAGFTDQVEKILKQGIERQNIGLVTIMSLKEKGYLNEEQTKNLALLQNETNITDTKQKLEATTRELESFEKALEEAEAAVAKNPDNIVTIQSYGLGKGKASELIVKYREYIQRDIDTKKSFIESYKKDLVKLEA